MSLLQGKGFPITLALLVIALISGLIIYQCKLRAETTRIRERITLFERERHFFDQLIREASSSRDVLQKEVVELTKTLIVETNFTKYKRKDMQVMLTEENDLNAKRIADISLERTAYQNQLMKCRLITQMLMINKTGYVIALEKSKQFYCSADLLSMRVDLRMDENRLTSLQTQAKNLKSLLGEIQKRYSELSSTFAGAIKMIEELYAAKDNYCKQ